ncbi:MFS transporter [Actinosynnema pretiosum subsp. pretiosum]|uniref:Major facilitator superfamily MFS_1 n=2 Tax=Actinosynnema TaxID=40566 RepID=C6WFI1_ACTMD|nr:MFS transporter [Actinosynnema mirum]ACU35916.1 major facilitator superfamily MFS_1 [Actinosynnema mirum DSM 43827]AXX29338.1 Antibiotic efflux protein [Actinosynnema pretiosum subsp. pretiosum]QUF06410.1 MFS transporter [Actinosynnema pretiosum subsp. pretiosum]
MAKTKIRLGSEFTGLWLSNAVANLGDGLSVAAGPLLLASLTSDPLLVAASLFAQQAPWLLFSPLGAALLDRGPDRRLLLVALTTTRCAVVAALAALVWLDLATIPVVYALLFTLGAAGALADGAIGALVPALVPAADLGTANSRVSAGTLAGSTLLGPALGAWLFAVAAAAPFTAEALGFAVAAVLLRGRRQAPPIEVVTRAAPPPPPSLAEGLRWLWHNRLLRLLALALLLMNMTLYGFLGVLVLYARERLDAGPAAFGLLLAATAAGGVLVVPLVPRLVDRFGPVPLLRAGLVVETVAHVALALVRAFPAAIAVLVVFGAHSVLWGTITRTARARVVPDRLRRSVNGAFLLFSSGGAALGAIQGGLVARAFGVTGPLWVAAVVVGLLSALTWQLLAVVGGEDG